MAHQVDMQGFTVTASSFNTLDVLIKKHSLFVDLEDFYVNLLMPSIRYFKANPECDEFKIIRRASNGVDTAVSLDPMSYDEKTLMLSHGEVGWHLRINPAA